jgi:hypothetical protein
MTASPGKSGESGGTVVERGPACPDPERISTSFVERSGVPLAGGMGTDTQSTFRYGHLIAWMEDHRSDFDQWAEEFDAVLKRHSDQAGAGNLQPLHRPSDRIR